jgi:SAM-dependent methyltransferase
MRSHRLSVVGRSFEDEHFAADEDLERLGTSKYFFDWVLDAFEPFLKGRVLEVGAGTGTITRRLIERYPDVTVAALEPADNMFRELEPYAAVTDRVEAFKTTLGEYRISPQHRFDAVLYVNVLEHIEQDARELHLAAGALRPGGALLVFGPALEWLYSELDYKAGHYRRYSLPRLRAIVEAAGLEVERLYHFDALGVAPYFLVYRVLRRSSISGSTMWGYDRVVVPASRALQQVVPNPPVGKNFLLIARAR